MLNMFGKICLQFSLQLQGSDASHTLPPAPITQRTPLVMASAVV